MSHSHSEPPVPSTPAGQTPESPRRPSPRRRLLTGISVVAILTLGLNAILASNPCNPTGQVVEGETLRAWVAQDASALEGVAREVAADLAPALQPGALEASVAQRVAAMRASARRSATL